MKRTVIFTIGLIWAIASVTSCKKEEKRTVVFDDGRSLINAVAVAVGSDTKSHNAVCYEVRWDEGDRISVTDGTNTDSFTLISGAESTKGAFKQDLDETLNPSKTKISGNVEIISPASLRVGDHYEWPAAQAIDPPVPMYVGNTISGTGEETVYFSSLGSMLQIVLTASTENLALSSIKLYDSDKPMSGEFTIENGRAVITSTDKSGITLDTDGISLGKTAKYFNIALPAGKYENLHLDFTLADGRVYNMVSTTMPEIKHNSVAKIALYLDISHMPTGISLNYSNLILSPGDVYPVLKATVLPNNAENKNVIWSSSDESVVTVDHQSGKLTAIALGKATITATAQFSRLSTSCEVSVQELPLGVLTGKFSVSKNKRVYFSKGNMWKGTMDHRRRMTEGYHIEREQLGFQPTRDSAWRKDHISHFYFGQDPEVVYLDRYFGGTISKVGDIFFTNETEDTPNPNFSVYTRNTNSSVYTGEQEWKGVWRVLSAKEWNYLLNEREMTYGKPRYSNWHTGAILKNGIIYRGLYVYPDDFNSEPLLSPRMYSWEEINEMGILVLPVAGYRKDTKVEHVIVNLCVAEYWTSVSNDKDDTKAVSMRFEEKGYRDIGAIIDTEADRGIAHSVRLVRDVLE